MKIYIAELTDGENHFHFEESVDDLEWNDNVPYGGKASLKVKVLKNDDLFYVRIKLHANAKFYCDRCLVKFNRKVNEKGNFVWTTSISKQQEIDEDEIHFIQGKYIDLSMDVRDLMILGIPIKTLCKPECSGLCTKCGNNLNEGTCHCHFNSFNSRWDELKSLKL